MFGSRSRTSSESSETDHHGVRPSSPANDSPNKDARGLVGYDLEGKFTYSQVMKSNFGKKLKTTVDENGKFSYVSADMRPVPPGWYDVDKSKHKVPMGWYDPTKQ